MQTENGISKLPFVCCKRKQKKRKFVFLGRQTINGKLFAVSANMLIFVYIYIYIEIYISIYVLPFQYIYIYTENRNDKLPFVFCKWKFVYLGRQTVNSTGNQHLLFQQTYPSSVPVKIATMVHTFLV
jgi:hypothetical protein